MPDAAPRTPLEAVTRRRFLLGGWPWRSLGYLLTTVPPAVAAAVPLGLLGLPWLLLLRRATSPGDQAPGSLALLALLGAVLVGAFGPLVALPLADLERRRLRLVDTRHVTSGHLRPPADGMWSWLRTRYTERATWCAVGYTWLLVTVVPLLYGVVLTVLLLVGAFIAGPFLVDADAPVSLGFARVTTVGQALPYAVVGLAALPAVPYLLAALAGVHGALARPLLRAGSDQRLRDELVEVSRSRVRLVDAFEAERRRIERDLHDGAQQRLVSLTLKLGLARLDLPPGSPAADSVADAHREAKELMAELRELIEGIHPRILTDLGLPAALRELAERSAIPVGVRADVSDRPPDHVAVTAYFVVAEALTNVAKHSGATRAWVVAGRRADTLTVEVGDDGHGGADPRGGTGLTGLADRVAVVNGKMMLSSPVGGPTLLRVELPCAQNQPSFG